MPINKLPNNSEIEFKFEIYENDISNLLVNVEKNSNFAIAPCFDIYSDFYYRNKKFNINNSFVRKRLVTSFYNEDIGPYPLKDESPIINYYSFLRDGITTFIDPKTGKMGQYFKDIEYTLKRKHIIDGVESNEEYEVKCCEDNDKEINNFINQLLIENDYELYFQKQKRKAFYVIPVNGSKAFYGCRVEIVAVAKDYTDSVNNFYAEVEFTSARLKGQEEVNMTEVKETLQSLPLILFGIPFPEIELVPDSWDKILEKQNK